MPEAHQSTKFQGNMSVNYWCDTDSHDSKAKLRRRRKWIILMINTIALKYHLCNKTIFGIRWARVINPLVAGGAIVFFSETTSIQVAGRFSNVFTQNLKRSSRESCVFSESYRAGVRQLMTGIRTTVLINVIFSFMSTACQSLYYFTNICCWSRTSHDQKDGWWGPTCPHFLNPQQPLFFWALGESGNKLWTQQWRNHLHYWRHPAVTEQHCHLTRLKHVSVTDKALFSLQSSGVIGVTLCKICDGKSLLGLKFIHSG